MSRLVNQVKIYLAKNDTYEQFKQDKMFHAVSSVLYVA